MTLSLSFISTLPIIRQPFTKTIKNNNISKQQQKESRIITKTNKSLQITSSITTAPSSSSSSSIDLPIPIHVNDEQTLQSYIDSSNICVVKVYTTSCRSCLSIERPFKKLSNKYQQQYASFNIQCIQICYEKDNIQKAQFCQNLGIRAFPTFIFFKHSKRIDHITTNRISVIEETIQDLLEEE